ncbi:MAG: amino acid permease [Candidatus Aenigmarchaeota archaeon]|nr:amino acid permease [Candidatus Aenigmarchaeota archaeon]
MGIKQLTTFDVTNLVVGAIVGADIYIAASFGSGLLGPASILAWIIAGIFATMIALTFARCSGVVKQIGGPYAYAKKAFGHFYGFITGWSLWLAELAALCVFPLAFVTYFSFFTPIDFVLKAILILAFVSFMFITNYFGIKKAARTNDIITIIKLAPLFLLITVGLIWIYSNPSTALNNLTPFAPFGFAGMGSVIVLVFWAYAGFELATIPSSEIKDSKKTVPKAIILGMVIVSAFYILTNIVILSSVNYVDLAHQQTPLAYSALILMGGIGALVMVIGAMISVSGSNESGLIGSVRLSYAMAADGYFPKYFAELHNKYSTPYISLAIHTGIAFFAAMFLPIYTLIVFSVFCLVFAYAMVAISAIKLRKDLFTKVLGISSILICIYLVSQSTLVSILAGIILIAIGIPIYMFFTPKSEIKLAKKEFFKRENVLKRRLEREEVFLARFVKHIKQHTRKNKKLSD